MTATKWPKGFTRGLPDREGCYVCIVKNYDNFANFDCFSVELFEIEEYGALAAAELGIKPGLATADCEDDVVINIEDCGIVGYHWICESYWPILTASSFEGDSE